MAKSLYLWQQKVKLLITLSGKKVPIPQWLQGPMEKSKGQERKKLHHLILGLEKCYRRRLQQGRRWFYGVHGQTEPLQSVTR